ncbi:MAG TPA: hypothetical protein VHI13_17275, partial [Candidatus Kapabacteria bacterium]|nr:hypothetical protein [Candidatus Kapabacteria bacterium]
MTRTGMLPSIISLCAVSAAVHAQPRGNPEHPSVKQLQWWGTIQGEHLVCPDHSEEFARYTF